MENGIGSRLLLAATGASVITVVYLVSVAIYRYFFHPLAKFPGPTINAISWVSAITAPRVPVSLGKVGYLELT